MRMKERLGWVGGSLIGLAFLLACHAWIFGQGWTSGGFGTPRYYKYTTDLAKYELMLSAVLTVVGVGMVAYHQSRKRR